MMAAAAASVAALLDVRSRRVPNWLSGAVLLSGVLVHVWQSGPTGFVVALTGSVLGLALLLPFYAAGGIGAGDVKLLSGLGALLGAQLLVSVAVYGAIAGGAMSLVILMRRQRLLLLFREVWALRGAPTQSGATAPYAVAIAAGVYLSLLLPRVLG